VPRPVAAAAVEARQGRVRDSFRPEEVHAEGDAQTVEAVADGEPLPRPAVQGALDHFTVTAVRPAYFPRWEGQQYDGCRLVAFAPTEVQVDDAHELKGFGLALTFLDTEARAGCEVICSWRVFDEVLRLARQPE
jgi:hypothetical protein